MKNIRTIATFLLLIICSAHGMQKSLTELTQRMNELGNEQTAIMGSLIERRISPEKVIKDQCALLQQFAQLYKDLSVASDNVHEAQTFARVHEYYVQEEKKYKSLVQSSASSQELFEKLNQLWPN